MWFKCYDLDHKVLEVFEVSRPVPGRDTQRSFWPSPSSSELFRYTPASYQPGVELRTILRTFSDFQSPFLRSPLLSLNLDHVINDVTLPGVLSLATSLR